MRFALVLLVGALLLGPSRSSAADGEEAGQQSAADQASELSRLGVEHYKAGRFPEAVNAMLAAHKLVPDATLLYNVARIYQKMEQPELAVYYFKLFVVEPGADPDTVQAALEHMEALRRDKPAPTESSAPVLETQPAPAPAAAEPEKEQQRPQAAAVAPAVQRRAMHPAPWITGSLAGAGLATLGICGALALEEQDVALDPTVELIQRQEAKALSDDLGMAADIGLGVGVAAAVATVILALATRDKAPPVVLVPVGPGGGPGLGLSMQFGKATRRSP